MEVIILCGGKGTRAYPFSEYFPKVMMPIAGTPILIHLMRSFAVQGFDHFILAAGHRQEVLRDYFAGRFPEWKVNIVDTGAESDTGERIRRCRQHVGERFFATYGDGLGNVDLHVLLRSHLNSRAIASVTTVPLRSQYGTVIFDRAGCVERFQEKPVIHDCWINAGFFVFDQEVFEYWEGTNLESDVLPNLAKLRKLYAYTHHGFWKSMDTSKDQQEMESLYNVSCPPWMSVSEQRSLAATNGTHS